MAPRAFAVHTRKTLELPAETEEVKIEHFNIYIDKTYKLIEISISLMDRNKYIGIDNLHI